MFALLGFLLCSHASSLRLFAKQPECSHNRQAALKNYKEGKANAWFFHITHHAGTTLRKMAKENDISKDDNFAHMESDHRAGTLTINPKILYTDFTEKDLPKNLAESLPCNSDEFVSIINIRDPIWRILSGDGSWVTNGTLNTDACNTDNYGLRKLIGKGFGNALTESDVAFAKQRLEMFDIVIDVAQISDSMKMLCSELGWKKCSVEQRPQADPKTMVPPEVYEKWVQRNRPELEVYRYAQTLSKAQREKSQSFARQMSQDQSKRLYIDLDKQESHLGWTCRGGSV